MLPFGLSIRCPSQVGEGIRETGERFEVPVVCVHYCLLHLVCQLLV